MKGYVFMLMGENFVPEKHTCSFKVGGGETRVVTVRSPQEAKEKIVQLQQEGIGAVELCGAFSEGLVHELTELTGNRLPIGYIVHNPAQDELFDAFFSNAQA